MKKTTQVVAQVAIGTAYLFAAVDSTYAQTANVVQDNFTGTSANLSWTAFNGACLTAGNNSGSVPACKGLAYYNTQTQFGLTSNKDAVGSGALRLTNGTPAYQQNGAIISNTPFPAGEGIQVTFTTYTYGGDNSGGHGADGIGFYLLNGSQTPNIGAWGGSLGYTCSNQNPPYDGMVGAYLGLGIDEYGNFLNQGDNTAAGYGYQPGRIGLRGNGSVSWNALNTNSPSNYPSSLTSSQRQSAVQNTCNSGYVWNYSNSDRPRQTSTPVADYAPINAAACSANPQACAYVVLPSGTPIANESAANRTQATPITYKLRITQDGILSFWYSYNGGTYTPVLANQSISASNGALPSSLIFGFGGSTGGSDNVHEITCFQATPADLSSSSAGVNVQQAGQVRTGTQVYLAYYHPNNWWGELDSQNLVVNTTTGAVTISSLADWDASCVLTGGSCPATGATGMTAQGPSSRTLVTWDGTQGIPFAWSNLTSTEQGWLNAGDNRGQSRLAYLSGDRTNELTTSGTGLFRARNSILGDIIDSSPTWVGYPSSPFPAVWSDLLYAAAIPLENAGTQTYPQFRTTNATRLNVVYDAANDGFLHGFRAGSYDSSGNYVNNSTTPNDGHEVLAYMPQAVLQAIHTGNSALDYSSTSYAHNFYTDATPGTGDLFYNGTWHTWLVSGMGAGGKAIFALDITNPANFSTATASSIVKGEWNPVTLACAGDTSTSMCGNDLGQTYGTPQIRRLHNGKWGIIFGNGLKSTTGHAAIYVMTIDPVTGNASTVYFLDTGVGSSSSPDGIAYVTPADLDGDHITDYVYGGDVYGNVWRFDLTSSNPSSWHVSKYGQSVGTPLFTTPNQPITTQLMVLSTPTASGAPQVMIDFGTGLVIPQTTSAAIQYAPGQQSLYGIFDWSLGKSGSAGSLWNAVSATRYASLTGTSNAPSSAISTSQLQQQTVTSQTTATQTGSGQGYRTVSNTSVCFVGSTCTTTTNGTTTTSAGTRFGWYMNLPGYTGVSGVGSSNQTEQVIYNPIGVFGAFIVNTTVPTNNSPFTCGAQTAQGWTMAINPATGGAFPQSFFADANNNFVNINGAPVSGVALNATGSPSVVTASLRPYLVNQTASGAGAVNQVNPPGDSKGGRLTWIQLN